MIQINGKIYEGNNITMNNNTITIDGANINDEFGGSAPIQVSGDIHSLETDGSVNAGGSIKCNRAGLLMSDEICFSDEEVASILITLEEDRKYLNNEVYERCDYDIYCMLLDKLDNIERMFRE